MKKLLSLILAAIMLAAILCGCAEKNSDAPESEAPASEAGEIQNSDDSGAKKKFLFSTVSLEGGLSIFDELMRPAIEEYGYEYECLSCDGDAVKQIEQIENAVVQGYDMIFVYPVTGEALSDACKAAMDAGVYIYVFLNDTVNYDVIFCDDSEANGRMIGEMSLQWVDETFPDAAEGSVNAAILGSTSDAYQTIMSKAAREVIYADKRINVLEDYDIEYSTSAAQSAAENVMTMHPDKEINLWVSISAVQIDGINAAVTAENSGVQDISLVGAIYPSPLSGEAVEKLKLSQDNSTIVRGIMCTGGDLGENFKSIAAECDALMRGEEVEKFHYSPIEPVWIEDLPAYGY